MPAKLVSVLTSRGSTYLTSTLNYDTTGQVTSVSDPKGHTTSYSYADSFFTDSSSYPNPRVRDVEVTV